MSESVNDFLHRFELERAGVRGVLVRLSRSWQQVRARADYPPALAGLLGRTLAASALLTGNIKFDGALSIQIKHAGPIDLLFAECGSDGRVRGLARWHGDIADEFRLDAAQPAPLLAITIDNRGSGQRYQGLVPVEDARLAAAFEGYFERSEQLPTRVVLAGDAQGSAGIMLQRLPGEGSNDTEAWHRVGHLLASVNDGELLGLAPETLLYRLFHEENVRLHDGKPLRFGCSCSRERVAAMLHCIGRAEAEAAVREDGFAEVTCEFCNTPYRFDRVDLEHVFHAAESAPAASTRH
ncbi:MAG: Hsp33 family molecular chaperone HslO [Proteobacteria bacterium]|nr:Hsp33 family molecular chaperone HslO [Pseudomonadota bacterium]